jgi:hypothetical protein
MIDVMLRGLRSLDMSAVATDSATLSEMWFEKLRHECCGD